MPKRSVLKTLGIAAIAMALAACTADAPPPAPASDAEEPAPEASPEVTELVPSAEQLTPGRYVRSQFEPRLTFAVGESWYAVQSFDGFFDVQQDVDSPDVIAVQFLRPTAAFGPDGAQEPESAADAAEILSGNPDLTVIESSESRIGGLTGSQVTVVNAGDDLARVMRVAAGGFGIDPGRRLWIAFFDTEAGLVAIMVGGSTERWDEALTAAEPVLESIQFED